MAKDESPRNWLVPGADEFYRGIYTRAWSGGRETLAVWSAISGEGRTTLSLGMAVTIAQDFPACRVALVETDFDRPVLAGDFAVESTPGLTECLSDDLPIELAYRPTALNNLHIVVAGGPNRNSGRLLRSGRMSAVLDSLRDDHEVIILDAPAALVNSDALQVADLADGVLFVVRAGVTPSSLVSKALDLVEEPKLRGVVLNATRSQVPGWLRRLCSV